MNVLVVVAHPDDEIIGLGGTLYKHIDNGDNVSVVIVSEGKSSRYNRYDDFNQTVAENYRQETEKALSILRINDYKLLEYANNRLDRYELLDLVKKLEELIAEVSPDIIYTHYHKEMNIDHNIVSRAVLTATRPLPHQSVKEVILFETLSSTEYALALGESFCPNLFVDITPYLDKKIEAMKAYQSELREVPHPRSLEMIKKNSELWGAKIGVHAAEAFIVSRIIR